MKNFLALFLLAACISTCPAAECNKSVARDIVVMMHEFATWRIEGDHLAVRWQYKIEKQSTSKQLEMITTYANMDACLSGAAREIHFYRKEKLLGIASPTTGIRLIK
jgi:hypothetical protein